MFEPASSTKRRRIHILVVVVAFFVAFALGIVIGYVAIKKPSEESKTQAVVHQDKKADLLKGREEIMNYHKKFQTTVSERELEKTLKWVKKSFTYIYNAKPNIFASCLSLGLEPLQIVHVIHEGSNYVKWQFEMYVQNCKCTALI